MIWLHPAQTPLAAAKVVKAGTPLPDLVLLDGFHLFRGVELRLLEAIARRSDVIVTFDPESGARARYDYHRFLDHLPNAEVLKLKRRAAACPETVTAGSASDREDQLRAIARQIKQRLTENPTLRPSDCAVAFRQVQPHLGPRPAGLLRVRPAPRSRCRRAPRRPALGRLAAPPAAPLRGMAGACETSPRCSRAASSTWADGDYPPRTWHGSNAREGRTTYGPDRTRLKRIADTMRAGARESLVRTDPRHGPPDCGRHGSRARRPAHPAGAAP